MVVPFAPRSLNSTDPCEGVVAYGMLRQPRSQELRDVNLGMFIYTTVMWLGALAAHYHYRNTPRFRKVRPISLTAVLIVGLLMYHAAAYLMYVVAMPCALVVVLYLLSITWVTVFPTIRLLAIVLETRYAFLTSRDGPGIFTRDAESTSEVEYAHTKSEVLGRSLSKTLVTLVKVMVLPKTADTLELQDVVWIKQAYLSIVLIHSGPVILAIIILLALVPQYQTCTDCPIFLELPIALFSIIPLYIIMMLRMAWEAYKKVKWDDKGVIAELLQVPFVAFPLALVVWLLMIVDPDNIEFNNRFNWSLLFTVITWTWFLASFGYQFYMQFKSNRAVNKQRTHPSMDEVFSADPSVKKAFYEYAEKQYIVESMLFLDDIKTFKRFFYEKVDTWKVTKFKSLTETFILQGSKMEINVSYGTRAKVTARYEHLKKSPADAMYQDLFSIFDEAVTDVSRMIHNGAWLDFLKSRQKSSAGGPATPTSLRPFNSVRVEPGGI